MTATASVALRAEWWLERLLRKGVTDEDLELVGELQQVVRAHRRSQWRALERLLGALPAGVGGDLGERLLAIGDRATSAQAVAAVIELDWWADAPCEEPCP